MVTIGVIALSSPAKQGIDATNQVSASAGQPASTLLADAALLRPRAVEKRGLAGCDPPRDRGDAVRGGSGGGGGTDSCCPCYGGDCPGGGGGLCGDGGGTLTLTLTLTLTRTLTLTSP